MWLMDTNTNAQNVPREELWQQLDMWSPRLKVGHCSTCPPAEPGGARRRQVEGSMGTDPASWSRTRQELITIDGDAAAFLTTAQDFIFRSFLLSKPMQLNKNNDGASPYIIVPI